ncbi:hypothetical protein WME73_00880 [Sorangium sp. So ce302]|uniref:hypothetical protein n=1 Tax=Sorangium sp. So ce302 TaxID=3133297 RepID=UPI003F62B36C
MPVVELAPGAYGSALQPTTSPWTAEESETYWRACLRAGGVVGVDPVVPGSWLVALDALNSADLLHRVLQVHFADGVPADLDEIGPFYGGLALVDDGENLVLPTCCGDLGDLDNWHIATEQRTDSPEMLWIGHPWLTVWYQAPMLHIREETEYNLPAHPREFAMNPEALQSAVRQATRELDLFCERVVVSLRELPGVLDARAIGRILVGKRDS